MDEAKPPDTEEPPSSQKDGESIQSPRSDRLPIRSLRGVYVRSFPMVYVCLSSGAKPFTRGFNSEDMD